MHIMQLYINTKDDEKLICYGKEVLTEDRSQCEKCHMLQWTGCESNSPLNINQNLAPEYSTRLKPKLTILSKVSLQYLKQIAMQYTDQVLALLHLQ